MSLYDKTPPAAVSNLIFRPIEAADNPALKLFMASQFDGGRFKYQSMILPADIKGAKEILTPGNIGLAAWLPGRETPVGLVYAQPARLKWGRNADLYQGIMINGLAVDPHYRRQGIGKLLVSQLMKLVEETFTGGGLPLLIYAYIQGGNAGSQSTFRSLGATFTGSYLTGATVPTTTRSGRRWPGPEGSPAWAGFAVREMLPADSDTVVRGLNRFYAGYNLYRPLSLEVLEGWLAPRRLEGHPVSLTRYYVATNLAGEVVAGAGVLDATGLVEFRLVEKPGWFDILNRFARLVPPDGRITSRYLSHVWYDTNMLAAGRVLYRSILSRPALSAPALSLVFDPAGAALARLYRLAAFKPVLKNELVLLSRPEFDPAARLPLADQTG